jgi:hypothetical protein
VLVRLGHLELAEGSVLAARSCLERALELRRGLGDRRGVGMALAGLGLVGTFARDFDLDAAEAALDEALTVLVETGRDLWIAQTTARLAETALRASISSRSARSRSPRSDLHLARHDEVGAARVAQRLRTLEISLTGRKGRAGTTSRTRTTGRRSP